MTILGEIDRMQQCLATCQEDCVLQGEVLAKNFRIERIALQKAAFEASARMGKRRASHDVGNWCPLNLFARQHNGSLQIYWQLVYRDRHTRRIGYKHIAKKKSGGYDMRSLLSHAHDFEKDLVAEYEEDAQCQRERWGHLMKTKHHLARFDAATTADTALVRRIRAGVRHWPNASQA